MDEKGFDTNQNKKGGVMKQICEHENCDKQATVNCRFEQCSEKPDFICCAAHAEEHGFCVACGCFCAGTNDLNSAGYCDVCYAEIVAADEAMDRFEDDLFYGSDELYKD